MPILINAQNLPQAITLPAIEIEPIVQSIGTIYCRLRSLRRKEVVAIEQIHISPRLTESVYVLNDGERIIITQRKKILRPDDIDGIILDMPDSEPKWISNKIIDAFENRKNEIGLSALSKEIEDSWNNKFSFVQEKKNGDGEIITKGLRPPQIGGLHSIGAHWSLHTQPATIVMPTGTGKTETMLAASVAYRPGKILVIVPSRILRNQTGKKFIGLGLLRFLGTIQADVRKPIVGMLTKRPTSLADLKIFENCNVVISTMSALSSETVLGLAPEIASHIETLIVDEAHHIAAKTWSAFREYFKDKKVIQFTATPYRRDGKLVDGKVIFNYPLRNAQLDGYFKPISFQSVHEVDEAKGDRDIAIKAVEKLRQDIAGGYDHLMMARCENIDRARSIHSIYTEIAPDLNPVIVHSDGVNVSASLNSIMTRASRIVVCVDMLGEGFDLPQLKIAAVHDTHKSLAVLLQFTGRFTRVAADNIGDATVIANIANANVSAALERLYSEDADWNQLLSEFSSQAAQTHAALIDFLNESERLGEDDDDDTEISHHLLRPSSSAIIYRATAFTPENFFTAIPSGVDVHRVWLHRESNTLYFVTKVEPTLQWTRSRELRDRQWDLFVLHYSEAQNLLYLVSSDKSSTFQDLASSVGGTELIHGDNIFRSLGRINRLIFQNVGVRKHGRKNLSFAMYTGADVAQALTMTERGGSVKSNLSGTGWENGMPVSIGCSLKGRIWSRDVGTIPELVTFCEQIGAKVIDETIDTTGIIANVLIPEEIETLPNVGVINIDWPIEILRQSEERVMLRRNDVEEISLTLISIEFLRSLPDAHQIIFRIFADNDISWGSFAMTISAEHGFIVEQISEPPTSIAFGKINTTLAAFFSSYPPMIRFVDLSELDGNLLIRPQTPEEIIFPNEQITTIDWMGVDIRKESIWKNGVERQDSIQWKVAQLYFAEDFDVIFDDDSAGEAADLVCLKEYNDFIRLVLIHCKFTTSDEPGERVKDVVEVCSQAIRSAKWKWRFQDLCRHIISREKRLTSITRPTRFMNGNSAELNRFMKLSKFKEVKAEIIIVQPGVSQVTITADQTMILGATSSYLKETVNVDLELLCSA
ncbi:MAG: DEAD/DEAH box helicase family protein [Bacteroidota bacterium]